MLLNRKGNITNPQDPKQDLGIEEVTRKVKQVVSKRVFRGLGVRRCSKAPLGTCRTIEGIVSNRKETEGSLTSRRKNSSQRLALLLPCNNQF